MPSTGAIFSITKDDSKFKGQHTIAPLNGDIRRQFKDWLISEAWAELDKRVTNPEVYTRMATKIINDAGIGLYDWDEELAETAKFKRKGFEQHVWLRLRMAKNKIQAEQMSDFIDDCAIAHEGTTICSGVMRIQYLMAIADGWEPDPKELTPPILEGVIDEAALDILKSLIKKSTATS